MSAEFEFEGEEEVMAKLQRLFPEFKDAAKQGLADWGDDVISAAKRITPVDTGALRASGYTAPVQDIGDGISLELGYSAEYAGFVHENRTARHETGRAGFLEEPLMLKSAELLPRVVRMMERAAEGL
jgi:hypothetical protein